MTDDKTILHIEVRQLLEGTADGAFVVGKDRRILYWNQAAEGILGYSSQEVVGQTCYDVFGGQDNKDVGICRHHCPIVAACRMQKPTPNYDACCRTKSGDLRWINVSTLVFHTFGEDAHLMVVYLFRDNTKNKQNERFVRQVIDATRQLQDISAIDDHRTAETPAAASDLTDREFEILNLLANGLGTRNIAQVLCVSPATVRNHIQSILRKLGAHSRLQAVIHALKQGLITIGN